MGKALQKEYTVHGQTIGITCECLPALLVKAFKLTGCKRNGDKYSRPYTYDEEHKTVKGCPACAKIVKQLVNSTTGVFLRRLPSYQKC
jgi:hypothetical protein